MKIVVPLILVLAAVGYVGKTLLPPKNPGEFDIVAFGRLPVLAGVLMLHGAFGGAISAMLYKIVPFLTWLHLTQAGVKAPNVKKLLPDAPVRMQLRLHAACLCALVVAAILPSTTPLAGMLVVIEFAWLLANLIRVVRAGRRVRAAAPES